MSSVQAASETFEAELRLDSDAPGSVIRPEIYGHFAEHLGRGIYGGLWVGEKSTILNTRGIRNDVVAALKRLSIPVLRWPGGCFADEYHWKHGVGPREGRPRTINTHWGRVVENNHFGTHEFMDLCEMLGAKSYVCGNVGSGSVDEMMQWVEYMTSDADSSMAALRRQHGRDAPWKLAYFGVGNESWGCGGHMRPEFYADNYRRYASFVKNHSPERVQRVACGANGADYNWTEVLISSARNHMDALSLHFYTLPTGNWSRKGSATDFVEDQWHSTLLQALRMEELIVKHSAIMDKYDPEKRVGMVVDEWGTWYDAEPGKNPGFLEQQNTLRDALVAAVTLNIFNRHCDRVTMANVAQLVNVLQALILTDHERMLLTPTYHVFEMFKGHQGGTQLPVRLETPAYEFGNAAVPALHASASRDSAGATRLSIVNLDPNRPARLAVAGLSGKPSGRVLTASAMNAHNTFAAPLAVKPMPFDGVTTKANSATLLLPSKSIVVLDSAPS